MSSLPSSYDNWKLAEPPEPPRICKCGHDWDDHNEDGLTDDPIELLNALREIDRIVARERILPVARITEILDRVLAICQIRECGCRKFVAQEDRNPR